VLRIITLKSQFLLLLMKHKQSSYCSWNFSFNGCLGIYFCTLSQNLCELKPNPQTGWYPMTLSILYCSTWIILFIPSCSSIPSSILRPIYSIYVLYIYLIEFIPVYAAKRSFKYYKMPKIIILDPFVWINPYIIHIN